MHHDMMKDIRPQPEDSGKHSSKISTCMYIRGVSAMVGNSAKNIKVFLSFKTPVPPRPDNMEKSQDFKATNMTFLVLKMVSST